MAESTPPGAAFLLVQLGFFGARRFAARLAPLGLDPRSFGLLRAIDAADGQSQQALSADIGMHASKLVALVDELEQRGLVERHRSPDDRRAYALSLTATGRQALADARAAAEQHGRELLAALDPAERDELTHLLRKLADAHDLGGSILPGRPGPVG